MLNEYVYGIITKTRLPQTTRVSRQTEDFVNGFGTTDIIIIKQNVKLYWLEDEKLFKNFDCNHIILSLFDTNSIWRHCHK